MMTYTYLFESVAGEMERVYSNGDSHMVFPIDYQLLILKRHIVIKIHNGLSELLKRTIYTIQLLSL